MVGWRPSRPGGGARAGLVTDRWSSQAFKCGGRVEVPGEAAVAGKALRWCRFRVASSGPDPAVREVLCHRAGGGGPPLLWQRLMLLRGSLGG